MFEKTNKVLADVGISKLDKWVQESQPIREKMLDELINYTEKLVRYNLQHVRNILQGNRFDILEKK